MSEWISAKVTHTGAFEFFGMALQVILAYVHDSHGVTSLGSDSSTPVTIPCHTRHLMESGAICPNHQWASMTVSFSFGVTVDAIVALVVSIMQYSPLCLGIA